MVSYFYSRPCGRGDASERAVSRNSPPISTHAPAGGATGKLCAAIRAQLFLLTPLREGRLAVRRLAFLGGIFLLTPLREGRRGHRYKATRNCIHFYSRPCGRGDEDALDAAHKAIISTHAPAGGATKSNYICPTMVSYFYSRPCGRGDASERAVSRNSPPISTHAPAGGATGKLCAAIRAQLFLLTPLREGRLAVRRLAFLGGIFLLTPLREGRRGHRYKATRNCIHFYSRPCGRGDGIIYRTAGGPDFISTHAPAGGATRRQARRRGREVISTHAPAGGATRSSANTSACRSNFYSRPCGRGDRGEGGFDVVRQAISTHAPAGGATRISAPRNRQSAGISTHAPAGGATLRTGEGEMRQKLFLLTPLREGRRWASSQMRTNICGFLLTPLREGRRRRGRADAPGRCISTHAPAGGATITGGMTEWQADFISTHAPAGGATMSDAAGLVREAVFLLTPLREGRPPSIYGVTPTIAAFLLTPLREGRRSASSPADCAGPYFYSRPCGRGDEYESGERVPNSISTHAPAGGATIPDNLLPMLRDLFLLTPLREGRPKRPASRPQITRFLLTPLREGRLASRRGSISAGAISTHAPAGGATQSSS